MPVVPRRVDRTPGASQTESAPAESKLLHGTLTYEIRGAAYAVHGALGPGFLESIYEEALIRELAERGMAFERQWAVTVSYKGIVVGEHRLDLVVDRKVIVELKAQKGLSDAHRAQVISYLRASGLRVGLLMNFGTHKLEIERFVR